MHENHVFFLPVNVACRLLGLHDILLCVLTINVRNFTSDLLYA